MTFIDFKKYLLDADITLPKFSKLIKVSDKNLQSYKKKGEVPNAIASLVACFVSMNQNGIDYKQVIENLELKAKKKDGVGFAKSKQK